MSEITRRGAAAMMPFAAFALVACSTPNSISPDTPGARDFDFLSGRWRVAHRSLSQTSPGVFTWRESEGECVTQPLLGGMGNCEDHLIVPASGAYRAIGLRAFDPQTRRWSIWWLDSRAPHVLGAPVVGAFENGVGTFFGDETLDNQPIKVRFLWTEIETPAPLWQQAYSFDAGATWQTNWSMRFTRTR